MADIFLTGSDTINIKMSETEDQSIDIDVNIDATGRKLVEDILVKPKLSGSASTLISYGTDVPDSSTPGKIYIQI